MAVHWIGSGLVMERITRAPLLLCALLWCALPAASLAHEDGEGVDAGFAHITATIDADNLAAVEVSITETDDCAKFRAIGVSGERDGRTATGDLDQGEECVFNGTIALPERGRWSVTVAVSYDGHPTTISIPIAAANETASFERADWLHSDVSIETDSSERAWYRPSGTLAFAIIGFLVGTAIEFTRRWILARRAAG